MASSCFNCCASVCRDFRDFILNSGFLTIAIGITVGASFTTLITTFVSSFITPLISAIFGGADFSALYFTLNNSKFTYGLFFNALIAFLLIGISIYFGVVMPYSKLQESIYGKLVPCPECTEKVSPNATKCKHCCSYVKVVPEQMEMTRT